MSAHGLTISTLAVGDFNGDGKADVVAANAATSASINVMLNLGSNSFAAPASTATGTFGPSYLIPADFNGDGKSDLVLGYSNGVDQIFVSNGNGTFKSPYTFNTLSNPSFFSVGDFNHDGRTDVIVGNYLATYVYNGAGDGSLSLPGMSFSLGSSVAKGIVADFNGDGASDLAFPYAATTNNIGVYLATVTAASHAVSAWETDLAGNVSAATASTTITVDVTLPTASNFGGPGASILSTSPHYLTVVYGDDSGVNIASLTNNNILVTGPGGYSQLAAFVKATPNTNSLSTIGTYLVVAPTGGWSPSWNGLYTVSVQPAQVNDIAGNYVPGETLGTFTISISPAPPQAQLVAAADSGVSNSDGVTNFNNSTPATALQISVTNTLVNATIFAFADGYPIGNNVATGATTIITTFGSYALSDGVHSITVRQKIVGGAQSVDSTPLLITVITTPPLAQLSTLPTGATPANSVTITFSEAVYGLAIGNFQLTQNSQAIPLTAAQTLATTDHITWTLGNLSPLTASLGTYRLTLMASSGVTDLAGNALANSPVTTWALSPDLGVSISDGGVAAARGQSLVYAVNYALAAGAGNATGVVLTEAVPANSSFNAGLSDPRWSLGSGSTYTLFLGTLAAGASGSVPFAVAVNSSLPPQVVSLSNTAWIADDGADGGDSNPANNTATITTGITFLSLASTQVGDGTSQRSTLRGASIQFSEAVNVSATSFTLYYESVADNQAFGNGVVTSRTFTALSNTADVSFASPDGGVTWVLSPVVGGAVDRTNGGGDANGNAIFADGVYKLVLHGSAITDVATGTRNFNFGSDQTVSFADGSGVMANDFAALFGDVDGNGTVTNSDLRALKRAFGANGGVYNPALDFGGDETVISNYDLAQFKKRFLVELVY